MRKWRRAERQSTKSRSMSCRKRGSRVREGEGGLSLRHTTGDMLPNRMSWKFSISPWGPSSVSVSSESVTFRPALRRARLPLVAASCAFLVKERTAWLSEQEITLQQRIIPIESKEGSLKTGHQFRERYLRVLFWCGVFKGYVNPR